MAMNGLEGETHRLPLTITGSGVQPVDLGVAGDVKGGDGVTMSARVCETQRLHRLPLTLAGSGVQPMNLGVAGGWLER